MEPWTFIIVWIVIYPEIVSDPLVTGYYLTFTHVSGWISLKKVICAVKLYSGCTLPLILKLIREKRTWIFYK